MSIFNGPFHLFTSSVASCSFHRSRPLSPKYPENAFWPQGQLIGLQIGAKAETDWYFPGLRRNFAPLAARPRSGQEQSPACCLCISQIVRRSRTYQRQSTVATHAVARDANSLGVNLGKLAEHQSRELLIDVGIHIVAFAVRFSCSVHVETCPCTKVPGIVFTWNIETP